MRVSSLVAACLIVAVGTAGIVWFSDPATGWPWRAISAPVVPAFFVVFILMGGPHGSSAGWLPATVIVAVAMWCVVIEAGHYVWNRAKHG